MGGEMKFITLTTHRSGSSPFQRMLNSHPDIIARQEDLRTILEDKDKCWSFMDTLYAGTMGFKKAIGYKAMYSHMRPHIMEYIKNNDVKIIQVIRRDILETVIWYPWCRISGNVEGGMGPPMKVKTKVKVDPKRVRNECMRIKDEIDFYKEYADFVIYYEDDIARGKDVRDFANIKKKKDLLKFMGVRFVELKVDPKANTKNKRKKTSELITNYDEVLKEISKEWRYYEE